MTSLSLAAASQLSTNCQLLQEFVKAARPRNPAVNVDLLIADQPFDHVLRCIGELYNAACQIDVQANVDIIPRFEAKRCLTVEDLNPKLGYVLHGHVAMGGTFDRLHLGHKLLLTQSILQTRNRLRIGITGEGMLNAASKKKAHFEYVQPFELRSGAVFDFVSKIREPGKDIAYDIVELTEPSGGTTTIPDLDAMIVSEETLSTIDWINTERAKNKLGPVRAEVIRFVGGEDNDARVSSSKLRKLAAEADAQAKEEERAKEPTF